MADIKKSLTDLEKGKPALLYYLYGEEPYKIAEFLDKIRGALFPNVAKKDLAFSLDQLDGAVANGHEIVDTIQSTGLFACSSGARLVVVKNARQIKEPEAISESLSSSPWEPNVLVLIADNIDGRRKFHQWLKKQGYALEFKKAKDSELIQWANYLAKKLGAKLSVDAALRLAQSCDGSLFRLSQEVEKAWLFAGAQSGIEVSADHVASVSAKKIGHEMIELVDSVLQEKRTRALLLANDIIAAPEDALGFVGFLTWAIKNNPIASARRWQLLDGLVELDRRLKNSKVDSKTVVDAFLLEKR